MSPIHAGPYRMCLWTRRAYSGNDNFHKRSRSIAKRYQPYHIIHMVMQNSRLCNRHMFSRCRTPPGWCTIQRNSYPRKNPCWNKNWHYFMRSHLLREMVVCPFHALPSPTQILLETCNHNIHSNPMHQTR